MAKNTKILPDIKGTESIAGSWRRLLTRDRNVSNLFSGDSFTEDQDATEDIGRPNWRTDLNRLFIWNGENWVNLFTLIEPYEIAYTVDHPDVPSEVNDLKKILDLLVSRNNLNTLTMPAESISYTADGSSSTYSLPRYTSNKSSALIFIDGVKQEKDTYDLASDGLSIVFKTIPNRNERIEIVQNSSLLEWDYSPVVQYFTGDGSNKVFTLDQDALSNITTSVNVAGTELQKNQFTVDGKKVTLNTAPANGASVQISIIGKTSFVTVSPNSIGTNELVDGAVTEAKLADNIPVNVNNISDKSIVTRMLGDKSVNTAKLADSAVNSAKIANGAVTEAKLATSVSEKLLNTNSVATNMLQDSSVTKAKLSSDILSNYYTKAEIDALINQLRNELGN